MVAAWAVGGGGRGSRLPLLLTALWAAAVALELAYVLVRGPGLPAAGPLARALHLLLAAFQLLNVLGNAALFVLRDPGIGGVLLAGRALGRGWDYCYQCQSQVPPRSGHCPACRVCILRRDHHCLLLGRCVGFSNYRPFLCLLFHGAGILLHITALLGPALGALLRAHSQLHAVALLLLPWLMLLTGGVSLAQFALAFIADTCVAGALLCGAGLLFHGMLLLRGQTTREWAHGQRLYDLGPWRNMQAALGSRWALVWFWPFLSSPLPGDGITFQTPG
ncbi:probable palmitoyltransferase ZDHHC24 [Trichosurus vulpecula]|uniref:probable palmitoyltransferase ZDHHC24 n=1 Tax=Trichosurus vulpecula TaxID=9337 RepID=UPI00186ADD06|nr:probable palmitoyltransferase ZDHHC24 [Trichosurus vulpecula]